MKIQQKFNAKFITETFFPETRPYKINMGRCFIWAYLSSYLFEGVDLYDLPIHAFVKYKDKFFDAERPLGVKDWRNLPASDFGNHYCGDNYFAIKRSPSSFRKEWRLQAHRFNTSWKQIEASTKGILK